MSFSSLLRLLILPARFARRVLSISLGSVQFGWTPPPWLRATVRHPRWALLAVLSLTAAGYGSSAWYRSREANRPRPRELVDVRKVEGTMAPVSVPGWDKVAGKSVASPVIIRFKSDSAPIDEFGREATVRPATIRPDVKGVWKWTTARELTFEPEAPLPAGETFQVTLQPGGFATNTELVKRDLEFKTPPLQVEAARPTFDTDPSDPARHQGVITIQFNQSVTPAEFSRALTVDIVGDSPLFQGETKPEVVVSPENGGRFHVRTPLVTIPEREDFLRFRISGSVVARSGGRPLEKEFVEKLTVPTRETGFRIASANTQLVPDADGEPQQFIFVEASRSVVAADFAKHVEAWQLPPPPKSKDGEEIWSVGNVTGAVLARAQRVPLEFVPGDVGSPHSATLAFRLRPRAPGPLWVRVAKGVSVIGGFVLGSDFGQSVMVPAFPKEVSILGDGGVLALTGERKLSVKSRGFEHLRFTLGRVPAGQINHLVSQTGGDFQSPHFRGSTFGIGNIARSKTSVTSIAKKNDHEASYSAFDFGPELARALAGDKDPARGLFFIEAEGVRPRTDEDEAAAAEDPDPKWIALASDGSDVPWGEENDHDERRFVLVTDLGVVVKRGADGKRDVFVMSFDKRSPVAGVQVTALARNGEPLAEVMTDAQGHAELPALDGHKREKKPVAIVARKANDLAFIPWARDDRQVELSRFDIDGVPASETGKLEAFLFTERGVYRPGDDIQFAAIVRRRDWKGTLGGVPLRAVLTNAREQVVSQVPVSLSPDGFIEIKLGTQEMAPTGVWSIDLQQLTKDGEETEHLGRVRVRVEDFQPDRLKLVAKLNRETPGWLAPKDLAVDLDLQTLFDLPAAERRVTAKLRVSPGQPEFAAWKGWHFHLPELEPFEARELDLGEKKTDAAGKASFTLDLQAHTAPLLRVGVDIEAFEADGGRGVQAGLSTLVSPHERLLGWKADGDLGYISRDVPCTVRVIALGRDLKATPAPDLTRVLLESRQISVLAKQENGSLSYVSQQRDQEVERVDGSLPAEEVAIPLPVSRAGRFRYEWRDAKGAVLCAIAFNVVGPAEVNRSLQRDSELELALPKREWRSGDQLELSIRAPYAGAGLITIERERVLAWKWFQADSASSIQHIAVPEGIEGGAYVHVAFVRRLDAPEIFVNPLSVGVLPFKISTEKRRLPIQLEAPKLARPGTPVVIGISTPRPSRVAVWAVDDGIHRVTNYALPKPLSAFFQTPCLEVSTWQLLDLLLPEFSIVKKSRAYGGDGDSPELKMGLNPFKRKRNAPVVYWSGIVECGPERKELTYQIPDYFAGRLNIMGVAVAPDALGAAETSTIVKGPFVLTPNVPVFAAPDDEFIASLTVANQTDPVVEQVEVNAAVSENLELLESPQPIVTIASNTEQTLRFRVRVKPKLGNAEIRFAVGTAPNRVEFTSTLSVRPAAPAMTRIESGWFRADTHEVEVGLPLYQEFASREAKLSATPLGLSAGLALYLRQFPHGCTEQTTSKALPWLLTTAEAESGASRQEAEKAISHACDILSSRQRSDGGFGYWTSANGQDGLDNLTVYVAHFLSEAKASGFDIPETLFDGTMKRLKSMASARVNNRYEAGTQAAAIYLLTRSGEVTTNYALNLTDTLKRKYDGRWHRDVSAAWLAGTWMLLKMEKEGRDLLAQHRAAMATPLDEKERQASFYDCGLSSAAQSFIVICRHFPDVAAELSYDDLKPITEPVMRGEFHTHSAAWTILALKSYTAMAKASAMELSMTEQVGGAWRELAQGPFSLDATRIQFRRKTAPDAPQAGAWYQTMEFGFPKALATKPETRGLELFREFVTADGKPVVETKVGETLKLRLRVRNVYRDHLDNIALTDLLPGGFENAPNDLRPGLNALPGATNVDVREDRNLLFLDLDAGASRTFEWTVRPTCAGRFVVPAAFGEAMYDRAISGSGVSTQIVVQSR